MKIDSTATFKMVLRNGPYTDVGGYPLFFVDGDKDVHCFTCVFNRRVEHIRRLRSESARKYDFFWHIAAVEVNWDDPDLECWCCNKHIESAYGDNND